MPVTPLHYCIAYTTKKLRKGWSLPALIVGNFIPDLENPVIFALNRFGVIHLSASGWLIDRLVLHSLVGASTIGLALALLITVYLYPALASMIFKVDAREECKASRKLVVPCLVGAISHVLVDALHHSYNPLLFPFTTSSVDAFVLFGDAELATVVVHVAFLVWALAILIYEFKKSGGRGFWEAVLVGEKGA